MRELFFANDKTLLREFSNQIIQNSHLKSMVDTMEIRSNMNLEELYGFIKTQGRFSNGPGITGMSTPYAAGARTLLHIFKEAGLLPLGIDLETRPKAVKEKIRIPIPKKRKNPQTRAMKPTYIQEVQTETDSKSIGKITVKGVGTVDISDTDSFDAAESLWNLLKKKVNSLKKE